MIRRLLVGLFLITLVPLAGCQRKEEPVRDEAARPVLSMVVEPRPGPEVRLAGTVMPEVQAELGFRLAGRLASRSVNVGDRVVAGQVVAEIDATSLELALRAAKGDLALAEAQLENAQGIELRQRELLEGGNVTETSFELVELRLSLAQATLARAQSNLRKAEDQLGYAQLRAGFDGVVTVVDVDPGSDVKPGQPVISIAKPDLRDAVIDVPEAVVGDLAIGTEFTVSLQLEPAIIARGILREIGPEADPATRTRRIRIGLAESPPAFRIGTTVWVTTPAGDAPIEIPLPAIRDDGQRTYVWVVDAGKGTVSQQEVTIVDRHDGVVVVGSGLAAGMRIAVAGVNSLTEGQKIQVTGADK